MALSYSRKHVLLLNTHPHLRPGEILTSTSTVVAILVNLIFPIQTAVHSIPPIITFRSVVNIAPQGEWFNLSSMNVIQSKSWWILNNGARSVSSNF